MSTTNLFVELIVIGIGAFAWIALLLLTIFGIDLELLRWLSSTPALAIPALSLIYLLGILTDRLADCTFHALRMDNKHRERYPGGSDQFHRDRALILSQSEHMAQLYEYSRSRQRICRGWAVNAMVLLFACILFIPTRLDTLVNVALVLPLTSILLALLALGCWWSWEALTDTELKRIKEQAALLAASVVAKD